MNAPTRPLGTPGTLPLPRPVNPQLIADPAKAPLSASRAAEEDAPFAQRPGRLSPTVSVGLPPRDPLAELSSSQSVSPISADESGAPIGPVLGRGSAAGFPPVTAERTLPAVPPFHPRTAAVANRQDSAASSNPTSSLLGAAGIRPGSASSLTPAHSTGPALESEVVPTPRFDELHVATDVADPFSSGPWSSNVNAAAPHVPASETRESPAALTGGSLGSRPPDAIAAPVAADSSVDAHSPAPVSLERETPRKKAGVSMAVAGLVAMLFGAGGFGFGYVTGASSHGDAGQVVAAAPTIEPEARRLGSPPPPPPPPEASHDVVVDLPETAVAEAKQNERRGKRANERASEDAPDSVGLQGEKGSDSLSGLAAGVGPAPAAGAGSERGTSTGLEAAAIQSTVQKNQNAVKRSCWQPALNGRSADAPSTARVTTTIQIAPNGAVTNVKHSGDPRGYPGLGGCIVTRVKTWTFPRANGSTTANIPFVFAAQ